MFAKKHDIIIVDYYIDRAISGTTDLRDSFQKILKDSNNKKWDYVKLLSAMENISETPEGVLLESLLEDMNQYFSEELAQKVSRGLHESNNRTI